ncbi:hypothetical protein YTPLAS18_16250 [Nitrospira sp.]|nr:hypothetical protein YTPLAS18_16250 [Nitrospira sp.]
MTRLADMSNVSEMKRSVYLHPLLVLLVGCVAAGFMGWTPDSAFALEPRTTTDPSGMSADPMGAPPYPHPGSPHGRSPHTKGGSPHHVTGHDMTPLLQDLKLSEEQSARLRRIETAYKSMTITKTAEIRVGEVELAALLDEREPDMGAITKAVNTIGSARTALTMGRVQSLLELKSILTAEQYDTFRSRLRERMGDFRAESSGHPSVHGF